jgi:hypothetical protein
MSHKANTKDGAQHPSGGEITQSQGLTLVHFYSSTDALSMGYSGWRQSVVSDKNGFSKRLGLS